MLLSQGFNQGAMMTLAPERRVHGIGDRRAFRRGGRRAEEQGRTEMSLLIPCEACGVAWASLASFEYQRRQSLAIYLCPRCGHLERRLAAA
jgi:hypothetical protein